ncbi:YigZ family protein [Mycoplasmopsis mucosicanis]|uniref:YigZ family protein n=1 Tax=Mycoplasmopsis mucosicanis TaxID=458208 RepID=A0A507SN97_9BACT|nr:YigZ family protein [Mycoplasmopsis mucosicanis]TQC51494.1 YigZ family protein [Mycoplasmopsis mucosicanis]
MNFHQYEIKKSRFYSICVPVFSKEELKNILQEIKKQYKKPDHICYGYSFFNENVINAGFDDDGEPKGTGGKPIRDLLIKTNTYNAVIFVVRYFGGIKLGNGLARAYKTSANLALKSYKEIK